MSSIIHASFPGLNATVPFALERLLHDSGQTSVMEQNDHLEAFVNHSPYTSSHDPILRVCHVEPGAVRAGEAELTAVLAGVCLEQTQQAFLACLDQMLESATPLLPDVEEGLDLLKERFLTDLRSCLDAAKFSPEQRIVVGLDPIGRLCLVDPAEHPALERIFAERQDLEDALREIAVQAALLRGIQDIGAARQARPGEQADLSLPGRYHVCLKGGLSHFYVPR